MNSEDQIIKYRFTAYLKTALKNTKINYLKRHAKYKEELSSGPEIPYDATYYDEVQDFIDKSEVFYLLDSYKPIEREIFLLHIFHGYSLKEISEIIGLKYNTTKSIYLRLIEKLKKRLEGEENGL